MSSHPHHILDHILLGSYSLKDKKRLISVRSIDLFSGLLPLEALKLYSVTFFASASNSVSLLVPVDTIFSLILTLHHPALLLLAGPGLVPDVVPALLPVQADPDAVHIVAGLGHHAGGA